MSGWGRLDAGDWPNPFAFALNVLFYSVLLRLLWRMLRLTQSAEKSRALRAMVPMVVLVLLYLIEGLLSYRPVTDLERSTLERSQRASLTEELLTLHPTWISQ
ncbi:MAG TPA: hypothetical protein VF707_03200 [Ardenticatenaceae bacterium]|jgi:hypothetical protein